MYTCKLYRLIGMQYATCCCDLFVERQTSLKNASRKSWLLAPMLFWQLAALTTFAWNTLLKVVRWLYDDARKLILGGLQKPLVVSTFRYASPCPWNQLPLSLRQPHSGTSSSISYLPISSPITSFSFDLPLSASITPSLFHYRLKTYLFHISYPPSFNFFLPNSFFYFSLFFSFLCCALD